MALDEIFKEEAFGQKVLEDVTVGYPGIVIGKAYKLGNEVFEPKDTHNYSSEIDFDDIEETQAEEIKARHQETQIALFEHARDRTLQAFSIKLDKANNLAFENREETKRLLNAQLDFIKGGSLERFVKAQVTAGKTAERAVYDFLNVNFIERYEKSKDPKERADAADYKNMLRHYMHGFDGKRPLPTLDEAPDDSIPVSIDTIPVGDMVLFRNEDGKGTRIHGFLDASGVQQGHTWIVAKGSRITSARLDENTIENINTDDDIIIDGPNKLVILNPSPKVRRHYEEQLNRFRENEKELIRRAHFRTSEGGGKYRKAVKSANHQDIKISANIGFSDEMAAVNYVNALTVGLYRTELAVLCRDDKDISSDGWEERWEERWYKLFEHLADQADGKAITLRTVDFEGDKVKEELKNFATDSKKQSRMIRAQMRAAIRVKAEHENASISMMIPMVDDPEKFEKMQDMMTKEAQNLEMRPLKLGSMVETVAIIDELDDVNAAYFSVGSNDLIPPILGYNRFDKEKANRKYDPTRPGVLRRLGRVVEYAPEGLEVSLCGEMASNPHHFALLIGMGYRHLSVGVGLVPHAKELARRINTQDAELLVDTLKTIKKRSDREEFLNSFNEERLGLSPNGTINLDWTPPEGGFDPNAERLEV